MAVAYKLDFNWNKAWMLLLEVRILKVLLRAVLIYGWVVVGGV